MNRREIYLETVYSRGSLWNVWPLPERRSGTPIRARSSIFSERGHSTLDNLRLKGSWPDGSGLGVWRWVVERTFAWLNQFRRLRIRDEKRADIHKALLSLACALFCWNVLKRCDRFRRADRTRASVCPPESRR